MNITTSTLPSIRNLAPYGYNEHNHVEDEAYSIEIVDAIAAGKRVYLLTERVCHGDGTFNLEVRPKREVCVTRFLDPRAAEVRYAVEIWTEGRNGQYDYADRAEATQSATEWARLIGFFV